MDDGALKRFEEITKKLKNIIINKFVNEEYIAIYVNRSEYFKNWKNTQDVLYMYPDEVMFNSPIVIKEDVLLITGILKK